MVCFPQLDLLFLFCILGACKLRLRAEESTVGNLHQINVSDANATGDFKTRDTFTSFRCQFIFSAKITVERLWQRSLIIISLIR